MISTLLWLLIAVGLFFGATLIGFAVAVLIRKEIQLSLPSTNTKLPLTSIRTKVHDRIKNHLMGAKNVVKMQNGIPVWQMGKWRLIGTDDWTAKTDQDFRQE
ncbi:UNVERIFIED_CONTAM: hypothetical protein HDU68_002374, partial [Siphonaria sp. JEL0065]